MTLEAVTFVELAGAATIAVKKQRDGGAGGRREKGQEMERKKKEGKEREREGVQQVE